MSDCKDCIHDDKEATDDPCYKCLSGYFGLPGFCPKPKEAKIAKKRAEKRYLPEDTPLPWSS